MHWNTAHTDYIIKSSRELQQWCTLMVSTFLMCFLWGIMMWIFAHITSYLLFHNYETNTKLDLYFSTFILKKCTNGRTKLHSYVCRKLGNEVVLLFFSVVDTWLMQFWIDDKNIGNTLGLYFYGHYILRAVKIVNLITLTGNHSERYPFVSEWYDIQFSSYHS